MMKAKVLAGVVGAVLLTASVVVGFFQHAAFTTQKSSHRGNRHSMSQVVAYAGSSGDDLSALLQSAKTDFGMGASKVAAKSATSAVDAATSAASSVTSTAAEPVKSAVYDTVTTVATPPAPAASTVVETGKALPLGDFIKARGTAPPAPSSADWDSTKAGWKLLRDNSIRFVGKDPEEFDKVSGKIASDFSAKSEEISSKLASEISAKSSEIGDKLATEISAKSSEVSSKVGSELSAKSSEISGKISSTELPKFSAADMPKFDAPDLSKFSVPEIPKFSAPDIPKFSAPDIPKMPAVEMPKFSVPDFNLPDFNFDVSSIQQYIEGLPEDVKLMGAVAVGVAFLIIGAAGNKEPPAKIEAASSEDIEATSAKIGGLTDELETLQSRMKALEANGFDLDSQLNEAKTKLTQKELDISKARLQAADTSVNLNREIDLLKQKLKDNDGKVQTLDEELSKAREECEYLIEELEKSRAAQAKEAAAEAAKLEKKKAEEAAAKKAEEAAAKKAEEAAAKKAEEAAAKKAEEAAAKKAAAEAAAKAAAEEAAAKKKAEEAAAKKKATAKKAAPKKKTAAKKKTVTKAKVEELPTAETVKPKAAAKKKRTTKKAATKKTVKKVEELPTADAPFFMEENPAPKKKAAAKKKVAAKKTADLTTLSKSALERTTVKVLVEFLDSKGVSTADGSGKTLKKAELLEAVRSL